METVKSDDRSEAKDQITQWRAATADTPLQSAQQVQDRLLDLYSALRAYPVIAEVEAAFEGGHGCVAPFGGGGISPTAIVTIPCRLLFLALPVPRSPVVPFVSWFLG